MKKLAMAIENFSRHGGGAEAYSVELARTLVSAGWEVHLFGHSWDGEPESAIFHRIPRLSKFFPPSVRILHFALSHRRMVQSEPFDVVLGFGATLVMNVYQSHGGVHLMSSMRKLQAIRNPVARIMKMLTLFAAPKYHARAWIESAAFRMTPRPKIVAISDMVRRDMADHFKVNKNEIRLIYNGIDQSRFGYPSRGHSQELRSKFGFRDEVLFLFMAYDFRKKGVKYLIEAASNLRQRVGPSKFGVVIVGNSPYPSLRRLVSRLKLADIVVFPGKTKEPEKFYQSCDVFMLPTFYDACSLVVFEAMAAGLPAITTCFNGASGIITEGVDGIVLNNPRNIQEMASAMERFLDRSALAAASAAATETAAKYTLQANHRQMIEVFTEVSNRWARPV
jgi:UDP-glucose:(heptosyl)LPS alpha-1,3-glucosyltransferase